MIFAQITEKVCVRGTCTVRSKAEISPVLHDNLETVRDRVLDVSVIHEFTQRPGTLCQLNFNLTFGAFKRIEDSSVYVDVALWI